MIGSRSGFTGNFIRIDLNANWTFTGQSDFHNMSIRMQLIVITKCTKKCFGFSTHNTVILSRSRCFKQILLIRDFVCQDRLCHLWLFYSTDNLKMLLKVSCKHSNRSSLPFPLPHCDFTLLWHKKHLHIRTQQRANQRILSYRGNRVSLSGWALVWMDVIMLCYVII